MWVISKLIIEGIKLNEWKWVFEWTWTKFDWSNFLANHKKEPSKCTFTVLIQSYLKKSILIWFTLMINWKWFKSKKWKIKDYPFLFPCFVHSKRVNKLFKDWSDPFLLINYHSNSVLKFGHNFLLISISINISNKSAKSSPFCLKHSKYFEGFKCPNQVFDLIANDLILTRSILFQKH